MLIPIFVEKKLNKEIKENIKNKQYRIDELKEINNEINTNYEKGKTGFITNAVIFLFVFGFIAYQSTQIRGFAMIGIMMSIVFYLIVLGIFYLNLTSAKRTFARLVKENYPNDYEQLLGK